MFLSQTRLLINIVCFGLAPCDELSNLSGSFYESYNSFNKSENDRDVFRSKSYYSYATVDEKSSHLPSKKQSRAQHGHASSITVSIVYATKSFNRLTTSNYFGFSGTAFASARLRHVEISKTLSLADIPSPDRKTPTAIMFFSFLTMISGLSAFTYPFLVARVGLGIIPLMLIIGIIVLYTGYLVHECQYQVSKSGARKRVYENYIDLGKSAIKWKGNLIMNIVVGSSVFTDIYYLIFCAQVSKDLLNNHIQLDGRIWMLLWVVLVFPLFFIRLMSILAWLGFFAIFMFVIALFFTIGLLIANYENWSFHNLNPSFNIKYFFIGYGIIVNSYNCHIAIPALEGIMKHPKHFEATAVGVFGINTLFKIIFGIVGAASFGLLTKGSVVSNLRSFGFRATIINILISLYMFAQYPGSMFVVFEMLDMHVLPKFKLFEKGKASEYVWLFLSRLFICVFISYIAVSIPNFETVTGFVGNMRGTLVTIILPIYFYLQIKKKSISNYSRVFHWILIIIASLMGLSGAGFACYEIAQTL